MITQKIIARTDSLKLDKIISRYGEDSMRQVVFIIVRPDPDSEELIPITIPEDAVGSFRILKPSGNFVIVPMNKSVLSTGETAFDVVLPASANTAKGSGYYDIRITSDTDKYYFTAQGDFLIDDNIISDEVLEDVSEVNGLIFPDDFLTVEDHVAYIDDDTISTDSTWSSNKINEEIEAHSGVDVSKTVSGNPIELTDAASAPLVKCVTEIQGSQDLHGYDKPWVGGAGKNKFGGEYNQFFPLHFSSEVTLTASADPVSGETPQIAYFDENQTQIDYWGMSQQYSSVSNRIARTFTYPTTAYYVKFINNETTNYQIEVSSTNTTYEPYSNICPITAYTEGEIEVTDGDGNTTTHTTTYPSAIYRGSEDVVKGEVKSEWVKVIVNGTNVQGISTGSTVDSEGGKRINLNIVNATPYSDQTEIPNVISDRLVAVSSYDMYIGTTPNSISINEIGQITIRYKGCATVEDAVSALNAEPIEIAYPLATSTPSPVTPTNLPIKSLSGYTHIESTTGDMEVEYITQRFQPLIDSIKQL